MRLVAPDFGRSGRSALATELTVSDVKVVVQRQATFAPSVGRDARQQLSDFAFQFHHARLGFDRRPALEIECRLSERLIDGSSESRHRARWIARRSSRALKHSQESVTECGQKAMLAQCL